MPTLSLFSKLKSLNAWAFPFLEGAYSLTKWTGLFWIFSSSTIFFFFTWGGHNSTRYSKCSHAINLYKDITQQKILLSGKNYLSSSNQITFNFVFTGNVVILFSVTAQILRICKYGDDWNLLKLSLITTIFCQVSRGRSGPPKPNNRPKVVKGRASKIITRGKKLLREKTMTEWSGGVYERI